MTKEDIAQAELEAKGALEDPDNGWYVADSFGTRAERFGDRLAKDDIDEKTFNKHIKMVASYGKASPKEKDAIDVEIAKYGWVAKFLLDPSIPTAQTWLSKCGSSNLSYLKELNYAYNSMTRHN